MIWVKVFTLFSLFVCLYVAFWLYLSDWLISMIFSFMITLIFDRFILFDKVENVEIFDDDLED